MVKRAMSFEYLNFLKECLMSYITKRSTGKNHKERTKLLGPFLFNKKNNPSQIKLYFKISAKHNKQKHIMP